MQKPYGRLLYFLLTQKNISNIYRDTLKQNMTNFMFILWFILENCPQNGENFLVSAFLEPNYIYFNYSYCFNENGEITEQIPRHFTDRNQNETDRYKRIAIDSVYDYNNKENRNISSSLTTDEMNTLKKICCNIENEVEIFISKYNLQQLMDIIQTRLIEAL